MQGLQEQGSGCSQEWQSLFLGFFFPNFNCFQRFVFPHFRSFLHLFFPHFSLFLHLFFLHLIFCLLFFFPHFGLFLRLFLPHLSRLLHFPGFIAFIFVQSSESTSEPLPGMFLKYGRELCSSPLPLPSLNAWHSSSSNKQEQTPLVCPHLQIISTVRCSSPHPTQRYPFHIHPIHPSHY